MTELAERKSTIKKISVYDMAKEIGLNPETLDIQIGINSYGHLTIRYLSLCPPTKPPSDRNDGEEEMKDILVVLDSTTTRKIMRFLGELLETFREFTLIRDP